MIFNASITRSLSITKQHIATIPFCRLNYPIYKSLKAGAVIILKG